MLPLGIFFALCILIFAVPALIVLSIKEYRRWRLATDIQRATACKPWVGKDNRNV